MFDSLEQITAFFEERRTLGIKPGLERMYRLLDSQSNPQQKFKAIHIAGTNGKGSTLNFIKAALIENNYRVGVFTSPSLIGHTGYMFIDNLPISEEHFLKLFNQLLPTINELDLENMYPTEFEIITTIAFMFFSGNVDIAIIEAGMGGREDTTNCIHPILSIITNIDIDHAYFLGDTLEKIAYQKSGIIKQNIPTILGGVHSLCLPVIKEEALIKKSVIYQLNKDFSCRTTSITQQSQNFIWSYKNYTFPIEIQMKGQHQVENASTAIMALQVMKDSGWKLNWNKVFSSFSTVKLAGRFEKILDHPVVILDGAHNPNGMEAFLSTVQNLYNNNTKELIFAGFHDKELGAMLQMALPYFDTISVTTFEHPRAEKAEKLIRNSPNGSVELVNWKEKVDEIMLEIDGVYFFAGSLAFIGLVREFITNKMK